MKVGDKVIVIKGGPDCGIKGVIVEISRKGRPVILTEKGKEWEVSEWDIEELQFLAEQGVLT